MRSSKWRRKKLEQRYTLVLAEGAQLALEANHLAQDDPVREKYVDAVQSRWDELGVLQSRMAYEARMAQQEAMLEDGEIPWSQEVFQQGLRGGF